MKVDICELKKEENKTFEWLKNHTSKINLKSKHIIDFYLWKNNTTIDKIPQYHCSPYWGEYTSNWKMRYMVIVDGDVEYLVLFRVIGVMTNSMYFGVSYHILRNDGNKDTENVYNILKSFSCIKSFEYIVNDDNYTNVNFYTDKDEIENRSRNFRKKINKANNTFEGKIVVFNKPTKTLLQDVKVFCDNFDKNRFKFNKKVLLKSVDIAIKEEAPIYSFYINDKLIGINVICSDFLNVCACHCGKDISGFDKEFISTEYCNGDTKFAQSIKNLLGRYIDHTVSNDCLKTYDALFIDGYRGDNRKGMMSHKINVTSKYIKYNQVNE